MRHGSTLNSNASDTVSVMILHVSCGKSNIRHFCNTKGKCCTATVKHSMSSRIPFRYMAEPTLTSVQVIQKSTLTIKVRMPKNHGSPLRRDQELPILKAYSGHRGRSH